MWLLKHKGMDQPKKAKTLQRGKAELFPAMVLRSAVRRGSLFQNLLL